MRTRPRTVAAALLTGAAVTALLVPAASASAAGSGGGCARWAATGGDDGASGTAAAPYRSLARLAASLAPGQTGCLPAGRTYEAVQGNGIVGTTRGTASAPVTITSGSGGRAVVRGQLWLRPESHDVVLRGLDLRGGYSASGAPLYTKNTFVIVHGDRIGLLGNDISNPRGICVGAGHAHATDATQNDVAEDLLLSGNRVHDCGMDPTVTWTAGDSGAHGIYLENTLRARVRDNLVYRNRYRGLQLWPRNDGAVIERNVFDENATQVNIGSSIGPQDGGSFVAQRTTVRGNVFSGRVRDWRTSQNPSQVYGYFPEGSATYGNLVQGNCFAPGDATATGNGYALGPNTVAQARFVDRAARDYRQRADSPCAGYGPAAAA